MVQGSKAERSDEVGVLVALLVPRTSIHQAVIAVTNALLLKLDFRLGFIEVLILDLFFYISCLINECVHTLLQIKLLTLFLLPS